MVHPTTGSTHDVNTPALGMMLTKIGSRRIFATENEPFSTGIQNVVRNPTRAASSMVNTTHSTTAATKKIAGPSPGSM